MRQNRTQIDTEIGQLASRLIRMESEFRVAYAHEQLTRLTTSPRGVYFALEEQTLWMTLYTHINWLAHFKFLKRSGVDKDVPDWLVEVFSWQEEVAKAFWECGRNPIAHTGNRSQTFNTKMKNIKYYIGLVLDSQEGWNGSNGYLPLSPMRKDIGGSDIPAQKYLFFYPDIETMIPMLVDNIQSSIEQLDHSKIVSLNTVCYSFPFIKDGGSRARMVDLFRIYKYAPKA